MWDYTGWLRKFHGILFASLNKDGKGVLRDVNLAWDPWRQDVEQFPTQNNFLSDQRSQKKLGSADSASGGGADSYADGCCCATKPLKGLTDRVESASWRTAWTARCLACDKFNAKKTGACRWVRQEDGKSHIVQTLARCVHTSRVSALNALTTYWKNIPVAPDHAILVEVFSVFGDLPTQRECERVPKILSSDIKKMATSKRKTSTDLGWNGYAMFSVSIGGCGAPFIGCKVNGMTRRWPGLSMRHSYQL